MSRLGILSLTLLALVVTTLAAGPAALPVASSPAAPDQDCAPQPITPIGTNFFTDISGPSGMQENNFSPEPVISNDHSRVAVADVDGDGWDDLVMHNGTQIDKKPFEHLIFRNNGDGTFSDFSDESGLRTVQSAFFAFADVDNDGDQDCFAGMDADRDGRLGLTHQLLLNDGHGHFTRKEDSGLEGAPGTPHVAATALFGDYNGDGNLDLYLGNGSAFVMMSDQFFLGHGDGTFEDASSRLKGGSAIRRTSNGGVACDYDNDNDLDLFISVYGAAPEMAYAHNVLWENDGQGNFTNVARERGFEALATGNYRLYTTGQGRDPEPVPQEHWMGGNGFGLQCEDVNNDGLLDIWLANISHPVASDYNRKWSDPSELLLNEGPAADYHFRNIYLDAGIPFNEGDLNASMIDFDNDGRMDLAMSREGKYEFQYRTWDLMAWFGLFHQTDDLTFESVGQISGINDPNDPAPTDHKRAKASGAHAWSDIDHDGDVDLLVGAFQRIADVGRANYLLRNDIGSQNAWLAIRLENDSTDFNRDALGSRVELVWTGLRQTRELKASHGMDNEDDTRVLHFGLGNLGCPRNVEVRWPNGQHEAFDGRAIGQNRYVTLRYGDGMAVLPTAEPAPLPTRAPDATTAFMPVSFDRSSPGQ
jgi:hypothetical protein